MAVGLLPVEEFLHHSKGGLIVDVRAPSEFSRGHIPGSVNVPVFTDEHRALVGTEFAREGQMAAIVLGLQLIGPELAGKARELLSRAHPGSRVFVYCWRGGMRSEAMSWLFGLLGYEVFRLKGGYKAFRRVVQQSFASPYKLHVVAGATGSGKTEILTELQHIGQQVVDLEALANHRGSAFGGLGLGDQPSTEQFENLLWKHLGFFDSSKPVWVEDESISVGRCFVPAPFFKAMQEAPAWVVEVPRSSRIERLVEMYGSVSFDLLGEALVKISKRLGGDRYQSASKALERGDLGKVAEEVLFYYDKAYLYCLSHRDPSRVCRISVPDNPAATAIQLVALSHTTL